MIPFAQYSNVIDLQSDMRIFNHPDLLKWYKSKFHDCKNDIYVYNGFDYDSKSTLSKLEARKKFNFNENKKYFVFTGSSSYWHGIDYLVDLQKELNI